MKEEGNKRNGGRGNNDDDAKEKSAVRSSVSLFSEEEVEKPWPLPFL